MTTTNESTLNADNDMYSRLKENLNIDDHLLFDHIDRWEQHSIAKIHRAAQQARDDLKHFLQSKSQQLLQAIIDINEHFADSDQKVSLDVLNIQLKQLQQKLSQISSEIYLEHDRTKYPVCLIKLTSMKHNLDQRLDNFQFVTADTIDVPGMSALLRPTFSQAIRDDQKQMIGERLFLLVQQFQPRFAAKITGMFLEWDLKYVLALVKSPSVLDTKIREAMAILQSHQYRQNYSLPFNYQ